MKHTIIAPACALWLAGCSTAVRDKLAIQDPTVLQRGFSTEQSESAGAAVRQWTDVYGQIKAPREVRASLQSRLDGLGSGKENYFGYKDQCWLDAANEEIALQNGWGFVEEALGESARLTTELEAGRATSLDNPSLRTVAPLRLDLAASLGVMRSDSRFAYCPQAQREVACMEVKLMHAGHDAWARNFDAAQEKVDAVERVMREARTSRRLCGAAASGCRCAASAENHAIGRCALRVRSRRHRVDHGERQVEARFGNRRREACRRPVGGRGFRLYRPARQRGL
jgi:hypothetical protein